MGNLRDKYTNEEWDEMDRQMREDKKNGKPDSHIIHLSAFGKTNNELKEIRKAIKPFFDDYELRELDAWITWNNRAVGGN